MILTILLGLCSGSTWAFRGPHHPRSSVSHHHYAPQKDVKLTQDAELLHDATHLKEDMGSVADQLDISKMTEQELDFFYFNLHDIDNNTKLDGLEMLHAYQHTLHEQDEEKELADYEDNKNADYLPWIIELVDRTLEEDDLDNDGYLGYIEFVLGRQRDKKETVKRDATLTIRQ
ncbi:multiple coagulation factor deficiency protein 2 homolog [Orussus abietinus]|uniref:multiple coagulation factor deficiency protein 2 homolog n=1 Tax=Orussus abietinus TaxID=222816 RepID=UPI000625150E|nr:multiple coagulation factor deficiency protein 2 homolog [Orussus abietinus]